MANFVRVAAVGDVPPGTGKCVEAGGKQIALFNVGGAYYAIDDTCPHKGGPLSQGAVEGETVTCPWHRSKFDIKTGAVIAPPAVTGVGSYRVRVSGSDVEVEV